MLMRTHLIITLFLVLFFISYVENKTVFFLVAMIATLIPDIDTGYSTLGRKKIFKPLQFFVKHRGILHSFIFLFLVTLLFVFFIPILAFPFFLGYSLHLFSDSFTVQGIKPFYPFHKTLSGKIRTGSKLETSVFTLFILGDLFLFVFRISSLF